MKLFFAWIIAATLSFSQPPQRMVVQIDGFRQQVGQAMVFVFTNDDDFPTKRDRAFASKKTPVTDTVLIVPFDNVPWGVYGIAVYHDENLNDKMDRSWYGMPKEGYGASNDATGTFGPPKFKDAKFEFKNSRDTVKIILHY